eukprot:1004440-Prorocentrum_minimum.AAC.1
MVIFGHVVGIFGHVVGIFGHVQKTVLEAAAQAKERLASGDLQVQQMNNNINYALRSRTMILTTHWGIAP